METDFKYISTAEFQYIDFNEKKVFHHQFEGKPNYFKIRITEEHKDKLMPPWLSARNGELILPTMIQEYLGTNQNVTEVIQSISDKINLRLTLQQKGNASKIQNSDEQTQHTHTNFFEELVYTMNKFVGTESDTYHSKLLNNWYYHKLYEKNRMRLYEPKNIFTLTVIEPESSTDKPINPSNEELLFGELFCIPFCTVPTISNFNLLMENFDKIFEKIGNFIQIEKHIYSYDNSTLRSFDFMTILYNTSIFFSLQDEKQKLETLLNSPDVYDSVHQEAKRLTKILNIVQHCSVFMFCERRAIDNEFQPVCGIVKDIHRKINVIEKIENHPEGGRLKIEKYKQFIALGYVLLTFTLATYVAVANIANRDNLFERLSDFVTTVVSLLFTVIGILKLTTEDPHVVKNTLYGWKIIRTLDDVMKATRAKSETELKRLVSASRKLHWLSKDECPYVFAKPNGKIQLLGGLSLSEIRKSQNFVIGNIIFRTIRDNNGHEITLETNGNICRHNEVTVKLTNNDIVIPNELIFK